MVEGDKRGREEIRQKDGGGRENQLTSQNQVQHLGGRRQERKGG